MENCKLKKWFLFESVCKSVCEKAVIKFDDAEIEKHGFYQYKRPISIKNIDIN